LNVAGWNRSNAGSNRNLPYGKECGLKYLVRGTIMLEIYP
jgi:hypothetical protein